MTSVCCSVFIESLIQKHSQNSRLSDSLWKLLSVVSIFMAAVLAYINKPFPSPYQRLLLPSSHFAPIAASPVPSSAAAPSIAPLSSVATSPTEIWAKTQKHISFLRNMPMLWTLLTFKGCSCFCTPPDGRESSGLGSPHWLQEFLRAKFMLPQDLEQTKIPQTELWRWSTHETPHPD